MTPTYFSFRSHPAWLRSGPDGRASSRPAFALPGRWFSRLRWLVALLVLGLSACDLKDPAEPGALVPKTVDEDASLSAVTLSNTKLHYELRGDPAKPLLIILHGGAGSDYRYMLSLADRYNGYALTDEYSLLFYDQRGSGLSRRHSRASELSFAIMEQDLAELIQRFSPTRKVVLIGHSWGGMLATQYLNNHLDKVAGCVLMETGELSGNIARQRKTVVSDLARKKRTLNMLQTPSWHREFITAKDHERADYSIAVAGVEDSKSSPTRNTDKFWRFGYYCTKLLAIDEFNRYGWDFTTNLARFTPKVLFINGDTELVGDAFQQQYHVRLFPRVESRKFVNCEHAGMLTNPAYQAQTISSLRTYLDEVL